METSDSTDIRVTIADSIPGHDHLALYRDAGWLQPGQDQERLAACIRGSFVLVVAVTADGRHVGMGRLISDGVTDGYIQDVAVLTEFRGRGLGALIVRALADEGVRRGLDWIGLVAAPGTIGFYERIGFSPMPGHTPMLLNISDRMVRR